MEGRRRSGRRRKEEGETGGKEGEERKAPGVLAGICPKAAELETRKSLGLCANQPSLLFQQTNK